jgi:hypothetical protein
MTIYAIEITAKGVPYNFHTTKVDVLRELVSETRALGHLEGVTIWADNEKMHRDAMVRLAFGTLPFED